MDTKKQYRPLMALLNENLSETVADLMPAIRSITDLQVSGGHIALYSLDVHVASFCFYHKKFEPIGTGDGQVEYVTKKSASTGLSTMCREGLNAFSARQRKYRLGMDKVHAQRLMDPPLISSADALAVITDLEIARTVYTPREDGVGFDSQEDLEESLGMELSDRPTTDQ